MKKVLLSLMALLLLASSGLKARADVIFEPYDDDFYTSHQEECKTTYYWSSFRFKEDTSVFVSPEDHALNGTVQAGEVFSSNTSWKDEEGETWYYVEGTIRSYSDYERNVFTTRTIKTSWVPADACEQLYDATLFEKDHQQYFKNGTKPEITEPVTATFFSYPNGPVLETRELSGSSEGMELTCSSTYIDEYGRKWGYVGYFYGAVNGWIFLDDLSADYDAVHAGLPEKETETTESVSESTAGQESESASEHESESASEQASESQSAAESTEENTASTVAETSETAEETKPEKTSESAAESTEKAETVTSYSEESSSKSLTASAIKNPVPLVAASVGGVVVIAGALLLLMKKKKK